MPARNQDITYRTRLLGWKEFAQGADHDAKSVRGLGKAAEDAGRKAGRSQRGFGVFARETDRAERKARSASRGIGGLTKGIFALGAGFVGIQGLRGSMDATEELAMSTMRLRRTFGLTTRDASELAAVTQVYGIDSKQTAQSLGILSKNIQNAALQSDRYTAAMNRSGKHVAPTLGKQAAAFEKLGVSQQLLQSDDNIGVLNALADGFDGLKNGPEKTALGMTLFGRSWQKLAPVMSGGSRGLDELRGKARDLGATFSDTKEFEKYRTAQKEAKFATLGLQIALGKTLTPALTKGSEAWVALVRDLRDGTGPLGLVGKEIGVLAHTAEGLVGWFGKSKTATKALQVGVAALTTAFAVNKILNWTRAIRDSTLATAVFGRTAGSAAAQQTAASTVSGLGVQLGERGRYRGRLRGIGRGMGGILGAGLAIGVIAQLPNLFQQLGKQLGLGDDFDHEAKRGFKALIPGKEDSAGLSPDAEHRSLRIWRRQEAAARRRDARRVRSAVRSDRRISPDRVGSLQDALGNPLMPRPRLIGPNRARIAALPALASGAPGGSWFDHVQDTPQVIHLVSKTVMPDGKVLAESTMEYMLRKKARK